MFSSFRSELADVYHHYTLVEAGEQEVVKALQESLRRYQHSKDLNKQLFHDRREYLSDTEVDKRQSFFSVLKILFELIIEFD